MPNSSYSALIRKLKVASRMAKERPEEALKLFEEVASQAKRHGDRTMLFLAQRENICVTQRLGRYEETVAMATECLETVKASCGVYSHPAVIDQRHDILDKLAFACGMTGRFDESKRALDELLASATRTYGHEHVDTYGFLRNRALLLLKMASKAEDLAIRGDLANGTRYLDAVLIEQEARDFFDAKDPNVHINCETMAVAASALGMIGRLQKSVAVSRLCIKSARERNDLDSELTQICMWNSARHSCDLYGPTKESKEVLDELLAIQTRLYGPDAPETQETKEFLCSLPQSDFSDVTQM